MPNPEIPIYNAPTNDDGTDGNDLIDCYFVEVGTTNTYNFYDQDGNQITTYVAGVASPVSNGVDFTFTYDDLSWTVTQFVISEEDLSASGSWSAVPVDKIADDGDAETGTFQAQGGGNEGEDERRSSASA